MASNSSLVTYTNLTSNKTTVKNKVNDTITIHCYVGQVTAKRGCDGFANTSKQASANYVVGKDGDIGLSVNEWDRAWTTGGGYTVNGETGSQNDYHAVTIEVACDSYYPYAVTDAAYEALIKLVADIAKRNNMGALKWKADKTLVTHPDQQNMTVHRWFAAKACPGDYLYERMGDIAAKANAINNEEDDEDMTQEKFNELMNTYMDNLAQQPTTWAQSYLDWAQSVGIMAGDNNGNLMPLKFCTRQEAVTMLNRLYELIKREEKQ